MIWSANPAVSHGGHDDAAFLAAGLELPGKGLLAWRESHQPVGRFEQRAAQRPIAGVGLPLATKGAPGCQTAETRQRFAVAEAGSVCSISARITHAVTSPIPRSLQSF